MVNISKKMISDIKYLFSRGLSYSKIAKDTGCSKTAVGRILKGITSEFEKKTGGRPPKLSAHLIKQVVRRFEKGEFKTTTDAIRYLHNGFNITVTKYTIRNILRKKGMRSYVKVKKPRLLPRHKLARLIFSREYSKKPGTFWENVIFSDESKFNLFGPDGYKRSWRFPNSPLQDWHIRSVVKFGGGSVMVWGCITSRGVGKLVFVEGRMDANQFIDVLVSGYGATLEMHKFNLNDVILQQDNDPKHNAKLTKEWLSEAEINVLPWPSCSPDMNIIEHVWNDVNNRIRNRENQPSNISELKIAVEEEWYSTPLEYIRSLYDSMPRRLKVLLKAKGGYTKY